MMRVGVDQWEKLTGGSLPSSTGCPLSFFPGYSTGWKLSSSNMLTFSQGKSLNSAGGTSHSFAVRHHLILSLVIRCVCVKILSRIWLRLSVNTGENKRCDGNCWRYDGGNSFWNVLIQCFPHSVHSIIGCNADSCMHFNSISNSNHIMTARSGFVDCFFPESHKYMKTVHTQSRVWTML